MCFPSLLIFQEKASNQSADVDFFVCVFSTQFWSFLFFKTDSNTLETFCALIVKHIRLTIVYWRTGVHSSAIWCWLEWCTRILLCAEVANANGNREWSRTLSECEMDRRVDGIKEQQTEREIKRWWLTHLILSLTVSSIASGYAHAHIGTHASLAHVIDSKQMPSEWSCQAGCWSAERRGNSRWRLSLTRHCIWRWSLVLPLGVFVCVSCCCCWQWGVTVGNLAKHFRL